jgi:hypothetical protein
VPYKSISVPIPNGLFAYSHAILSDGSLSTIALDHDMHAASRRDPGKADKLYPKARASIFLHDGATSISGPKLSLQIRYPIHDRFPDGRWLLVAARTAGEPNGHILTPDGQLIRSIMLGDGIEHAKIDDAGRIWVGWFDEGVFGNVNWKWAGREWPPSSDGLACFDDMGALLWSENDEAIKAGLQSLQIADCYALNVSGEEVWASPYTDFPLLNGGMGRTSRIWQTALIGPAALAIKPPFVIAAGNYDSKYAAVVIQLVGDTAKVLRHCILSPEPCDPKAALYLDGRGDRIHLVQNGQWHMWRVADFL